MLLRSSRLSNPNKEKSSWFPLSVVVEIENLPELNSKIRKVKLTLLKPQGAKNSPELNFLAIPNIKNGNA